MEYYKKILFLLSSQERKNAALVLVMILIMAFLDMIGVASIVPFMLVLTNPDIIETNIILKKMYQTSKMFGVENNQKFLFALGILVLFLLITSLGFKALTTYAQTRFILMREFTIGKRLVKGYLEQPYDWFLNRNSADLGKNILSEVSLVVAGSISALMKLIASGAVSIALIILLIVTDPKLAIISGLTLGISYGIIYKLTYSYLSKIGKQRVISNQSRFTAVSEAFGAAKEVKVGGLEKIYIERFSNPAEKFAKDMTSQQVVVLLPRFALEALAFGGIMLLILYLMRQTGSFNSSLPIISLYVFAGYRLLPALQQVYASLSSLTFSGPALDRMYNELKNLKPLELKQDESVLTLKKEISLKNIYYNYPNSSQSVLSDVNITIPAKTTIGLIGSTGAGKTTTVDIILGLLELQKGTLEIDGKVVTKNNIAVWQRSIGYVPQQIYLSDDTVEANIAFGVNPKDISKKAIEKASKIANLHDFVKNELPKQYQTIIGERGVRLSGGQRQRIGIARALYHNPDLLILDEATNALDNQTEKAVMDAVNKLSNNITIILIAHRLNTVKNCDIIYRIDKGKIVSQGTAKELFDNSKNLNQ